MIISNALRVTRFQIFMPQFLLSNRQVTTDRGTQDEASPDYVRGLIIFQEAEKDVVECIRTYPGNSIKLH